jgi:hypothetical protein
MTRVRARVVGAAIAAILMVAPASAFAGAKAAYKDTPKAVISDCSAGHYPLKGHYTIKVLQEALRKLDSSADQYTNCADVINDTINKLELAAHRRGSGGSGHRGAKITRGTDGNGSATTSIVKRRLKALTSKGGGPVTLPGIGQTVTPGTVTDRSASFLSSLPTPLLIVLAALLATVLAVSARSINNIVRSRRPR